MSNAATVVRQLITDRAKAKENESGWKSEGKRINDAISEIIKPEDVLESYGKMKNGGSKTVVIDGGKFTLKAEKGVKWDSDKLQNIASALTWAQCLALFKISFSITEATYAQLVLNAEAGLFDKKILDAINEARTVTIGEAKIESAELAD